MSTESSLRVLIIAPSQGKYGGLEASVFALAESLASARDFTPRLCFKLVQGANFSDELLNRCHKIGIPFSIATRASRKLWENLRWAQIVHAQNPSPDVAFGARLLRRPLVMTIINHRSRQDSLHTLMWDIAARMADTRCYISDFVRQTWEPSDVGDHNQVFPAVSQLPVRDVTWNRTGFFFIGRWIANKGIEELIEAYATAQFDHSRWPLTLAGDGPLRRLIESLITKHALTSVLQPGFVTEDEKFRLMGAAKWNVAPPHTQEDLGLTPIEARHLAVPSIVTRDGGLPEAAGPHALLAEPGDVPSLRAQLEEAAAMPEEEYRRRALASQAQLRDFLRPMSDYQIIYRQLADRG